MARLTYAQAAYSRGRVGLERLLGVLASATNPDGTEFSLPTIEGGSALVTRTGIASLPGDTALWTPAAGKRYRLLGAVLSVTGDAALALAGRMAVALNDGTASQIVATSIWLPGTSGTTLGNVTILSVNLGRKGFSSGTVDRVLNLNLSAAIAIGSVRANVWGYEE